MGNKMTYTIETSIRDTLTTQEIYRDLGFKLPKFGYSNVFEFNNKQEFEHFVEVIEANQIEFDIY